MNFKHIIIILLVSYFENLGLSEETTTKKLENKVTQCYYSREGQFNQKTFNDTLQKYNCKTNCISFQIKNGTQKIDINACAKNNDLCYGNQMIVKSSHHFSKYSCCETNLCNTPEFHSKNLNSKCEINKTINKNMKLTFKIKEPKTTTNVNKCYYCNNCTKESEFQIVKCNQQLQTNNANFACEVNYN